MSSETSSESDGCESCPSTLRPQLGEFTGSQVEFFSCESSFCGYCKIKGVESRHSYDMRLVRILPHDYQILLDINWRRSGNYSYHPLNWSTCCPNYGISCKTNKFRFSASQRRVIENLNSFLYNGSTKDKIPLDYSKTPICDIFKPHNDCDQDREPLTKRALDKLAESNKARCRRFIKACDRQATKHNISREAASKLVKERNLKRRNNFNKSILEQHLFPAKASLLTKPGETSERTVRKPKHQLNIRLIHVDSEESKSIRVEEHQLLVKYQQAVHKDDTREWTMARFSDFLVKSPLVVEPLKDRDYLWDENDDTLSKKCPLAGNSDYLILEPPELPTCYGSFHCTYRLDGKLIGVGVLDVLPKCVTTVYFFHDPDYRHLNLGIYSALVEISLVRQIQSHFVGPRGEKDKLIHYYLGFYVHVCEKMYYKTRFRPSYMLDCVSYRYMPTETCLPKLQLRKYARFYFDVNDCLYNPSLDDMLKVPVLAPISPYKISMGDYFQWIESNLGKQYVTMLVNDFLLQYVRLVGKQLASEMLLKTKYFHKVLIYRYRSVNTTRVTDRL